MLDEQPEDFETTRALAAVVQPAAVREGSAKPSSRAWHKARPRLGSSYALPCPSGPNDYFFQLLWLARSKKMEQPKSIFPTVVRRHEPDDAARSGGAWSLQPLLTSRYYTLKIHNIFYRVSSTFMARRRWVCGVFFSLPPSDKKPFPISVSRIAVWQCLHQQLHSFCGLFFCGLIYKNFIHNEGQ